MDNKIFVPIRYKRNYWKDWFLKDKDRRGITHNEDGSINIFIEDDNIIQQGSPITEKRMNNIETGLENTNSFAFSLSNNVKSLELSVALLNIAVFGGEYGEGIMQNFENIDDVNISRGVYDSDNQVVFSEDSNGELTVLRGFGAALA